MNRKQICQILGLVAMGVWSFVLLSFYASGRVEFYIRPEYLRTCSLLAGLGLAALTVFNALQLHRFRGETACCGHDHHDHDHDHDHGHGHDHHQDHAHEHHHDHGHGHDHDHDHEDNTLSGNLAMAMVLVVPMLAASTFSKDQFLSAQTIRNKGFATDSSAVANRVAGSLDGGTRAARETQEDEWEYTLADLEKVVDRSAEGYLKLTVDQLFYTAGDEELQRVLQGEGVEAVGQLLPPDPGIHANGKRLKLFTLMVTCCAADAQPVAIPIEFESTLPEYTEMSWARVLGTMRYAEEDGRIQPVLEVERIEPAEQPYSDMVF